MRIIILLLCLETSKHVPTCPPLVCPLISPTPTAALLNALKVFAERLYDILSHERGGGAQQPGFYPLAFGPDGRGASRFPRQLQPHQHQHQQHERNDPSSSSGTSSASPSSDGSPAHLPQQQPVRHNSFESTASAHRGGGEGSGGGGGGDGGEMGMSDLDQQILLARCGFAPPSAAAAAAATAEQDRQVMLARFRSSPAEFNRDHDHHHRYYRNNHPHYRQHSDASLMFGHSPNRSPVAGAGGGRGGGEYSFEGTRYGSHSSGPDGVLPPLPSLNFDQFSGGGGGGGVDRIHRAPWHGADSTYVK